MHDIPDAELLERFARSESEEAFAELVRRHVALVHSVALRHTDQPEQAQEITQAVFIVLARKAASLGARTVLSGWLYHTARLTAGNFRRAEFRRVRREQEAFMQSTLEEPAPDAVWRELAPLLDEAMARLGATDRDAVVLRNFQNKSLAEVGTALGLEERAAQKRVTRALEKLRTFFTKRGVTLSAAAIAGTVSASSVQAAPVALAKSVTAVAIAKGAAASGSTLALVNGTVKAMTWLKLKFVAGVGTAALLVGGVVTVAISSSRNTPGEAIQILRQSQAKYDSLSSYRETGRFVRNFNGNLSTNGFSARLGRPNFYRLDWQKPSAVVDGKAYNLWPNAEGDFLFWHNPSAMTDEKVNTLWSVGEGYFLHAPGGFIGATNSLYRLQDRRIAMATVGESAPISIPLVFFETNWGNVLTSLIASTNLMKQKDEILGGVPCHVLTGRIGRSTTTLWIGWDDLLIRQRRNVFDVSPIPLLQMRIDDTTAATELAKQKKPVTAQAIAERKRQMQKSLDQANQMLLQAEKSKPRRERVDVETHENIQINQPVAKLDFIPRIPEGLKPLEWSKAVIQKPSFE